MAGVPVVYVDPAYTSQMCAECGYTDKNNGVSRGSFTCRSCGHAQHADRNASRNIASSLAEAAPSLSSRASTEACAGVRSPSPVSSFSLRRRRLTATHASLAARTADSERPYCCASGASSVARPGSGGAARAAKTWPMNRS